MPKRCHLQYWGGETILRCFKRGPLGGKKGKSSKEERGKRASTALTMKGTNVRGYHVMGEVREELSEAPWPHF